MATVTAYDLYVRCAPGGVAFGYLVRGNTFDIYSGDSTWAYGYAHGCVNHVGYVLRQYLA